MADRDDKNKGLTGSSRLQEALKKRDIARSKLSDSFQFPTTALEKLDRDLERKEQQLNKLLVEKINLVMAQKAKDAEVIQAQINQTTEEINRYKSGGARQNEFYKARLASDTSRLSRSITSESEFFRSVQSATGSRQTISDIAQSRRMSATQQQARSMALNPSASTFQLQRDIERNRALLGGAAQRVEQAATASNIVNILSEKERTGDITPSEAEQLRQARSMSGMLGSRIGARERLIGSLATQEEAASQRKRFGLDVESRFIKARGAIGGIGEAIESEQIRKDVSLGRYNRKQVEEDLSNTAKKLLDTFEKLNDAFIKGASNADALAKEFEETKDQYDRQKQISRELGRAPGVSDRLGFIGQQIGGFGAGLSAIGQIYGYENVGAQQALIGNRIGAAQRANMVSRDVIAGAGGDFASIRRFITDQARLESEYAQTIRDKSRTAEGFGLAGSGVQVAAAGTSAAQNLLLAGAMGGGVGSLASIGANLGSTVGTVAAPTANFANNMSDFRYQNRSMAAGLASANQMRDYFDTVNQVGDFLGQQGMDFITGSATRLIGVGGTRSARGMQAAPATLAASMRTNAAVVAGATLNSLNIANPFEGGVGVLDSASSIFNAIPEAARKAGQTSNGLVNPLAAVDTMPVKQPVRDLADMLIEATSGDNLKALYEQSGVTKARVERAQAAAVQMGASFFGPPSMTDQEKKDQYVRDLSRVSRLEAAGRISQERFYGLQARMIQAGGQDSAKKVEDVFKTAIAAGFSDSRAFEKLVELSAQIAQNTKDTAMGIDVTGGAAALVGGMVQSQDGSKSLEQRIAAAQSTANVFQRNMTSQDLSLGNIMEMDLLTDRFKGASMSQIMQMQQLGPEALSEINRQFARGDKAGRSYIEQNFPGLSGVLTNRESAGQLSRIGVGSSLLNTTAIMTDPTLINKIQSYMAGDSSALSNLSRSELSALQNVGFAPNTLTGALEAIVSPEKVKRGEIDTSIGSALTLKQGREAGETYTAAEGTKAVLPEIEAFSAVMKAMGRMIDKDGFVGAAEAAATELKISSGEHIKAVKEMTAAMLDAASKIRGLGGSSSVSSGPNFNQIPEINSLWSNANNDALRRNIGIRR